MIRLGQIHHSPRLIRSVFAAFVLAWLQMAAVPCVMAGTMQTGSAVAMESQEGMDHVAIGHESPATQMPAETEGHHDCIYCPPSADAGRTTTPAGCAFPDQPQTDSRSSHLQFAHWVLPVAPDLHSFDPAIQRRPVRTLVHAAPPQPRPLTLTYCIQLK